MSVQERLAVLEEEFVRLREQDAQLLNASQEKMRVLEEELVKLRGERDFGKEWVMNYPDSGQFSSGIGSNIIDFKSGRVSRYDGKRDQLGADLDTLKVDYLSSLYFWADEEADLTFSYGSRTTQRINYDQCLTYDGIHIPFDMLQITFSLPGNFELVASSSIFGWNIARISSHQMRFSSGNTVDAFTPTRFQASEVSGARSSTDPSRMSPILHVPNMGTKTFMVFNTDPANGLDVNIQGKGDAGSSKWASDATTGASTLVASNSSAIFNVTSRFHFIRVRVRSDVANSSASYEIHYIGNTA